MQRFAQLRKKVTFDNFNFRIKKIEKKSSKCNVFTLFCFWHLSIHEKKNRQNTRISLELDVFPDNTSSSLAFLWPFSRRIFYEPNKRQKCPYPQRSYWPGSWLDHDLVSSCLRSRRPDLVFSRASIPQAFLRNIDVRNTKVWKNVQIPIVKKSWKCNIFDFDEKGSQKNIVKMQLFHFILKTKSEKNIVIMLRLCTFLL